LPASIGEARTVALFLFLREGEAVDGGAFESFIGIETGVAVGGACSQGPGLFFRMACALPTDGATLK
jgi:hypothetical protein